jgi:predicted lipid-binding transport protein (Tim44 family)
MNVMRVGGAITALLLGGLLVVLWMRERRRHKSQIDSPVPLSPASASAAPDATVSLRTTTAPPRPATNHAP